MCLLVTDSTAQHNVSQKYCLIHFKVYKVSIPGLKYPSNMFELVFQLLATKAILTDNAERCD